MHIKKGFDWQLNSTMSSQKSVRCRRSTIYKGLGTSMRVYPTHARTHARIVYQNKRSLAMFGRGRLSRSRFVCSRDLDRSRIRRRKEDTPPVSPSSAGFRPARSLAPFASLSAVIYRRVITARALSRDSPGSIPHDRDDRASAVREIEYLPPAGCSGGHTARSSWIKPSDLSRRE